MTINQVSIKNFKSLKDTNISLGDLTLITGVNSSGKSSFIQTLLLLKQNSESINKYVLFNSILNEHENDDKKGEHISHLKKLLTDIQPLILDGKYISLGEGKSLLYQEAFNEEIMLSLSNPQGNKITVSFGTDAIFSVNNCTDSEENRFGIEILINFHYIRTDRVIPKITYPLSESNVRADNIGLNGEYSAHYLALNRHKNLNITALKHPESKTEQLLENVSKWLGEMSSGIDISVTVHEQLQIASLTYQYVYGEQTTTQYTPLNVGFGLTYVLPVIIALLKSKSGDLLVIENPESHLHPAGQSKIAELCCIAAASGVQIIIETHSDHFLNGVRVATKKGTLQADKSKIYYFEKANDSMETITHSLSIDNDGRISDWPKGFFDEWDNKLNELLW